MQGNWQALFGKRPTEKDLPDGHLAGGHFTRGRAGETDQPRRSRCVRARSHWPTDALDEVRRGEWKALRRSGSAEAAKALKGLRFLLLRNWENLTGAQRSVVRQLDG